jgi:hypothetical protein
VIRRLRARQRWLVLVAAAAAALALAIALARRVPPRTQLLSPVLRQHADPR